MKFVEQLQLLRFAQVDAGELARSVPQPFGITPNVIERRERGVEVARRDEAECSAQLVAFLEDSTEYRDVAQDSRRPPPGNAHEGRRIARAAPGHGITREPLEPSESAERQPAQCRLVVARMSIGVIMEVGRISQWEVHSERVALQGSRDAEL